MEPSLQNISIYIAHWLRWLAVTSETTVLNRATMSVETYESMLVRKFIHDV